MIGADDSVVAVRGDVVREGDVRGEAVRDLHDAAGCALDDRVVIDRDVARRVAQKREVAVAAPRVAIDAVEHVVVDAEVVRFAARMVGIGAEHLQRRRDVAHHVAAELDVLDLAPWARAVLVAHGEQHRIAGLRLLPRALHHVALDEDAARVFQLEEIFHLPRGRAGRLPRERLAEHIVADDDLRRRELEDRRIGAAEHDVLARRLEVVVLDRVGAGPVPAGDCLRVLADRLDVAHVAADDRRLGGVEGDGALLPAIGVAMHVEAIERQVRRHCREGRLPSPAVAERDDVAGTVAVRDPQL